MERNTYYKDPQLITQPCIGIWPYGQEAAGTSRRLLAPPPRVSALAGSDAACQVLALGLAVPRVSAHSLYTPLFEVLGGAG